jgi:hypothetical protein
MPKRIGGDRPDPINTETEYKGKVPMPNTVSDLGPLGRKLEPHEKLRLGRLTGQEEDPYAPREPGFMAGVDSRFPEHPDLVVNVPKDYRSEDYLE